MRLLVTNIFKMNENLTRRTKKHQFCFKKKKEKINVDEDHEENSKNKINKFSQLGEKINIFFTGMHFLNLELFHLVSEKVDS